MFYVYALESEKDNDLYIGFTNNLERRLLEHNQGLNISTKARMPWRIVYYEACLSESDAMRREGYLKTTQGGRMLKIRLRDYLKSRNI